MGYRVRSKAANGWRNRLSMGAQRKSLKEMDPQIWAISLVSFLWSMSSLMVFSILPAFITEELHATHTHLGVLEGAAISISFVAKVFSGVGSDYFKNRKSLIMGGTFFSFLAKPIFAIAISYQWLFVARFLDRLSKGIRSSPTDALIADWANSRSRYGAFFGFRQSFYTLGAVFGAMASMVLMYVFHHNYRLVFALAVIPMGLSLLVLWGWVKDAPYIRAIPEGRQTKPWEFSNLSMLPWAFWLVMLITFFLMMARFSEAFVSLRARELGWPLIYLPLVIIVMDIVHAAVAFWAGSVADQLSRDKQLKYGMLLFVITDFAFIWAESIVGVGFAIVLLGCHMGVTQGLLRALVADATPKHLRGTAFAIFYLISGLAVLLGNILAGYFSDRFGLYGAFAGACTFVFTALGLSLLFGNQITPNTNEPISSKATI